jgi:hypothetical protein
MKDPGIAMIKPDNCVIMFHEFPLFYGRKRNAFARHARPQNFNAAI